ncbi:S8 family serine peptidase [Micromonospora sp. MS34]|uniref:S8 family serine peptidase n=1 Tax=Micromonospora sp. MS34 TaxID=3385971 RepID=UPI0039A22B97
MGQLEDVTPAWAWEGADGSGVRVCLLDSGVEADHAGAGPVDLALTVVDAPDGRLTVAEENPSVDRVGHGTACAAVIRSIAPAASLTSVRVLTDGIFGGGQALLAGLEWAIEQGYDVVNLSLSTTRPQLQQPLHDLADQAYFRRTLLVVAAHNMPVHSYPWTFASVVSVACHDEPEPMLHYYNPSPPAEFLAHGVRVLVPWLDSGDKRVTGNSFATPHISGLCALILSKHPWLTPFQVKSVLFMTARNVRELAGGPPCP